MDVTMYAVLGAAPGATDDELKAACEARLAALDREDAASTNDAARASVAAARVQVEQAWEILSDAALRMQYDLMAAAQHPDVTAPPSEPPPGSPTAGPGVHHDQPVAPVPDPAAPVPMHHLPPPPPGTLHDPHDVRRPPKPSECQLCGAAPVAKVVLRREVGMIFARQTHKVEGAYCRSCGISLFREMTDKTTIGGWWGFISFFVNWYSIARNIWARFQLGRLA